MEFVIHTIFLDTINSEPIWPQIKNHSVSKLLITIWNILGLFIEKEKVKQIKHSSNLEQGGL